MKLRTKVIIALAATGLIATACGSTNVADADENPVRTYQVPNGTVVCIFETKYVNSNAITGGLSCDWDHVIPNK
ncbi:hypothetical protein PBI_PEREGRIN_45 [Rhodococcus phage Peregrin]|nr:hypothetical protein PBI_PEREGRIN_45 [Rhodococcus phage Peregrin]